MGIPTLIAKRLLLTKLEPGDAPGIYAYQGDKENFPHVDMPVYTSIQEAHDYIQRMNAGADNDQWLIWAIRHQDTNAIMGTISIWNICSQEHKAELGFGLFPQFRGQGFMGEALAAVVSFGFTQMGLQVMEAYTNVNNFQSIALLEGSGFSYSTTIQELGFYSKEPLEMAVYRIHSVSKPQ